MAEIDLKVSCWGGVPSLPGLGSSVRCDRLLLLSLAGVRRQLVEYVLPINADSEVGVVKQEFKAARDLVEATLVQLKQVPELAVRRLLTQRSPTSHEVSCFIRYVHCL